MQKIGISVFEKMVEKKITNKELDFILYIARYQNEYGVAKGIYYKDVCEAAGLSFQGFYDCKASLEEKGIIYCTKKSYYDWDITILNNSFKGKENYGRGYISLHNNMVRSEEFRKCRVGAKLLALLLMRDYNIARKKSGKTAYQILKDNFLTKYKKMFGVTARVLRSYLGELTSFLDVYLEDGRKYYITFKKNATSMEVRSQSENEELREHDIKTSCRRNKVKTITEEEKKDLMTVLSQYHKRIEKQMFFDLSEVVSRCLAVINEGKKNKSKWKRQLNIPLLHKLLVEDLITA